MLDHSDRLEHLLPAQQYLYHRLAEKWLRFEARRDLVRTVAQQQGICACSASLAGRDLLSDIFYS